MGATEGGQNGQKGYNLHLRNPPALKMKSVIPADVEAMKNWKGKPREGKVIRDYVLDRNAVTDKRTGKSAPAAPVLDGNLDMILKP